MSNKGTGGTTETQTIDLPKGSTASRVSSWLIKNAEVRTGFVLIILVVAFAIATPNFTSPNNVITIISISSMLAIVTLGQTIVLISGGFDLSVGGVVPLSAVVFAMLTSNGTSLFVAIVCSLALGLIVGLTNAFIIGRFKVNALITTLGMMSITGGLAYVLSAGQTIGIPVEAGILGDRSVVFGLPNFALVAIVLAVLVDVFLRWSVPGRLVYSIGANAEAARVAGIRVEAVRGMSYGISGVFAALAGICFASQLLAAAGSIGTSTTLDSVTAAVLGGASLLGGIGSAPGAILGVLIIGVIQDGLALLQIQSFWAQIASGVVLIAAVAFSALRTSRR